MKIKMCFRAAAAMLALTVALAVNPVHAQTFSPLYSFNNDGGVDDTDPLGFVNPGTLAQGRDGNIYTTSQGGYVRNAGSFFNMSPTGVLSILDSFDPDTDGGCEDAISGVTLGSDGNFHGALTTCVSGSASGTVFTVTPAGGLNFQYIFTGGSDGFQPDTAPVEGRDGNFYGTTLRGGIADCGTIYQITPGGVVTTLHEFSGTDGCGSYAPLTLASDGNFYGVASSGGLNNGFGVAFRITTSGQYTVLFAFDGPHGSGPIGPLVQGRDGNLYGTTQGGGVGVNAFGVVFKMTKAGKVTVLHTFDPTSGDGAGPLAGLVQATDGYFYGVTSQGGTSLNCDGVGCGTIFRVNSRRIYSKLYDFDGTTGSSPLISLLQHTNGLLYGLSLHGGTYDSGVFFSLDEGLLPFVHLVSSSGPVGSTVGILGQGFTGAKKVAFAGIPTTFSVISDTYLTATVPVGAKSGNVVVKTLNSTLKSNTKFLVTP